MNVLKTLLLQLTAITIMNPYTICNHWLRCLLKPGLPDVEPDLPVLLFLSKERLVVSYYFKVNIADLVLHHKLVSEDLTKGWFTLDLDCPRWRGIIVRVSPGCPCSHYSLTNLIDVLENTWSLSKFDVHIWNLALLNYRVFINSWFSTPC